MFRYLCAVALAAIASTASVAQVALPEDVRGHFGSVGGQYCVRIPDGHVAKQSPGGEAFNLLLGEPGSGLVFFQTTIDADGEELPNIRGLIDARIGTRVRAQSEGNGAGQPTAVSLYPVNLPNLTRGDVAGVRFTYYDKRWGRTREEIVVFYRRLEGPQLHEFVLFSTPARFPQDHEVFDAILRSFRHAPC